MNPFATKLLRIVTSVPVITLMLVGCAEIFMRSFNIPSTFGYRSSDSWQISDRLSYCLKTVPDVTIVGSSLMLPLNQDGSGAHFYTGMRTPYLTELISKAAGEPIECLNLATGRQTVAEAYLIEKAVSSRKRYPKVLIYGLILREFVDEYYAGEWRGESFGAVAPYAPADLQSVGKIYSNRGMLDFLFSHYLYLYRDRSAIRNVLSANTKDFLDLMPLDMPYSRMYNFVQKPQHQGLLFERLTPQNMEAMMHEVNKRNPQNVRDTFRQHFTSMHAYPPRNAWKMQHHYLKSLAELCDEKEVLLVLVNMPISKEFQAIAPKGSYEGFQQWLDELSQKWGFFLVDLAFDPDFTEDRFKDGLHLDYEGSRILARKIVKALERDYPTILRTMAEEARERKSRER